jgi:hypothetical protein
MAQGNKPGGGRKGRKKGDWIGLSQGRAHAGNRIPFTMRNATQVCEHGSFYSVCKAKHQRAVAA